MIKNTQYAAYAEHKPEMIHDIIVGDGHTLTEEEKLYFNTDTFITDYEEFLTRINMPILALKIDVKKGTIKLHRETLARLGDSGLKDYQGMFVQHYNDAMDENDIGEYVEAPKNPGQEPPPPPQLQKQVREDMFPEARLKNAVHVDGVIAMMFNEGTLDALPDDYGWIENRKKVFFQKMDDLCEKYQMVRPQIRLNPDGSAEFMCTAEQEENYTALYKRRKNEEERGAIIDKETVIQRNRENFGLGLKNTVTSYTGTFNDNKDNMFASLDVIGLDVYNEAMEEQHNQFKPDLKHLILN